MESRKLTRLMTRGVGSSQLPSLLKFYIETKNKQKIKERKKFKNKVGKGCQDILKGRLTTPKYAELAA